MTCPYLTVKLGPADEHGHIDDREVRCAWFECELKSIESCDFCPDYEASEFREDVQEFLNTHAVGR